MVAAMAAPPKKTSKGTIVIISVVVLAVLAVPCIGVIAAIAIPSFIGYTRRAKTAEAETNLRSIFQGAAAYYVEEHPGPGGTTLTGCTVSSERTSNEPGSFKTMLSIAPGSSFDALGVAPMDPVYYQYEIESAGGCGHGPNEALYTFRAHGDLDGDGTPSRFELTAGSDPANELFRAPEVDRENEVE
ncbi:hypothetical protein GPROT1_03927 [Gammaproteobacteria bacterium]|nr:hypothetical protein GPROT1_03927 [Gammaproteobacteria bacterium]